MAQFLSALFFSLASAVAFMFIVAMLREEWARLTWIVSGQELTGAHAATPRIRVRTRRSALQSERRRSQPLHAAA